MQNVKQISELRLYRNIVYVCQTQSYHDNFLQTSLEDSYVFQPSILSN